MSTENKESKLDRVLFIKSHIKTYTKKDGTVVTAHDDNRAKKPELISYADETKAHTLSALAYHASSVANDTEETWKKHRDATNAHAQAESAQYHIENKSQAEKHSNLAKMHAAKATSILASHKAETF